MKAIPAIESLAGVSATEILVGLAIAIPLCYIFVLLSEGHDE